MKRFVFLIIFLTFSFSAFALDDNPLSFRITPRFELLNGSINEYVFDENCLNINNKVSQLDWDIKNIPVLGLKADFEVLHYIALSLDGSIGIPKVSGVMQDYDWLNNNNPTELTNYSKHTNNLNKYINFTANAGGNIYLPAEIKITPKIAYQYEFIALDGTNGFKTYKSDNWKISNFSGKVISYGQELNAMLTGFSISVDTLPMIHFFADLMFSPKLTFINALDYHYVKSTVYWDRIINLWQVKAYIEAQYKFNKYHCMGLSTSIQYIPISKGDTRVNDLNSNGKFIPEDWSGAIKNGGGTSRLIWSLGINYSFSL